MNLPNKVYGANDVDTNGKPFQLPMPVGRSVLPVVDRSLLMVAKVPARENPGEEEVVMVEIKRRIWWATNNESKRKTNQKNLLPTDAKLHIIMPKKEYSA